jgi:FtsH-binding integral membrane protein
MQNYPYAYGSGYQVDAAQRSATLGKVLGLLGTTAIFTALGALAAPWVGFGGLIIALIGGFVALIALGFVKERAPLNLILLYTFATLEGVLLGAVLESYLLQRGGAAVILDAAGTTAAVTLIAGTYGYTTKRDLSGLGSILFIGLLAVIVASFIGFFLHIPLFFLVLSAITALLFTGFLVFDLNRVANAGEVSQGDTILLAVSVYLDIFNLFLALLRIFGYLRGN